MSQIGKKTRAVALARAAATQGGTTRVRRTAATYHVTRLIARTCGLAGRELPAAEPTLLDS